MILTASHQNHRFTWTRCVPTARPGRRPDVRLNVQHDTKRRGTCRSDIVLKAGDSVEEAVRNRSRQQIEEREEGERRRDETDVCRETVVKVLVSLQSRK
ncbi:unnamed protein product [Pleuronectes platessa]|uniref:Uncharacterized protein n=1 Tax=Pleuronectes platessa TaxID=8262 RepID=A0A9N7TY18_PLEPL|nr:unnamed protein product [Pleuronectes platessa]